MEFFTSINANYLAKAKVLVRTLRQHHPDARFTLVLCERTREPYEEHLGAFDRVLLPADLDIPAESLAGWLFSHSVVETCTGVKPFAFRRLLELTGTDKIIYLDPDVVVLAPLTPEVAALDEHDILLTPHILDPDPT